MILAGLHKTSLIDFPGRVSCVVFLTGCNFTCPFCHNSELARGTYPQKIPLAQFIAFMTPRRKLLDGVVITGGEPTLNPRLTELCRAIRDAGLSIKLDTNGSRPNVLEQLFKDRLVDYVAMDIKTPLAEYHPLLTKREMVATLESSIRLIMEKAPDYEFRTTCVSPFVDGRKIIDMAHTIAGARRYVLQPFKAANMLQADFFENQTPEISRREIDRFRKASTPLVRECLIRNEI